MFQTSGVFTSSLLTIGLVYLLTGLVLLVLLREPMRRFDKPGSTGFAIAVIAISLWPLSHGLNSFTTDLAASMALWNVRMFAAGLVSVGWVILAVEFTRQRLPREHVLAVLVAYLFSAQVLTWTNPYHGLVVGPGTTLDNGFLVPEFGVGFWLQATINYAFILIATALLVGEWSRSSGLRRRQSLILAAAVIPPILANLVTILDVVGTIYDLTPFGLIGSGIILSWALYRMEVLDIVPVGREIAVEGMQDALVTVNDENRIVDCNPAARRLFDVDDDYFGMPMTDFFETVPKEVLAEFAPSGRTNSSDSRDSPGYRRDHTASTSDHTASTSDYTASASDHHQAEFTVTVDGQPRHLSMSVSAIPGSDPFRSGRVIVLRDVTMLKRREEELDLFRQVLTRVLRHNLRTELNKIQGYAELIEEAHDDAGTDDDDRVDDDDVVEDDDVGAVEDETVADEEELDDAGEAVAETAQDLETAGEKAREHTVGGVQFDGEDSTDDHVARILKASESLVRTSEKVGDIEEIIVADTGQELFDLVRIVDDAVTDARERYPDVTFGIAAPEACVVRTSPGIESAIENLVENAAAYNDSDDPRVHLSITPESDSVEIRIADNGPGIPDHELNVLAEGEETPLFHGSGIGLWIVQWWANRAGIAPTFETSDDGTVITITFPTGPEG